MYRSEIADLKLSIFAGLYQKNIWLPAKKLNDLSEFFIKRGDVLSFGEGESHIWGMTSLPQLTRCAPLRKVETSSATTGSKEPARREVNRRMTTAVTPLL